MSMPCCASHCTMCPLHRIVPLVVSLYNAAQVLAREVGRMREDHLAEEPDARWPLLTLARLLEAQV